ncbi:sodium:proline symporter [Psychrobacter okhotskensis]|uniref:sodium:proline symporter n=1 Tax=Psychrobacter okhotskensis TaxID=212403 RepID=UPI0015632F00|nr:sodium:proline symporter [Psychrobacter okhotskensis]NRD70066.1 sodium:proline symporter [Psychrobacter okhotskensis]
MTDSSSETYELAPDIARFYQGKSLQGQPPSLWTLILSQVTTWIFARSLMNAAVLGFFYGIAGTLAYGMYYFSFITGAHIVDSLRFKHGFNNIQTFMQVKFGATGEHLYNAVIGFRLVSEVFSNLLVFGFITTLFVGFNENYLILIIAVATLIYSSIGGLHTALKTDVAQALFTIFAIIVLAVAMFAHPLFSFNAIISSSNSADNKGWILMIVAFIQIWSYPAHDPVMTDRGFLADRATTKKSFYYAAPISMACILLFGLLGVFAQLNNAGGATEVTQTLNTLFSPAVMMLFSFALIISAISTLDSTYASAAKLIAIDMKLVKPTVKNGRLIMLGFLLAGLAFIATGSKDLFDAVAISGTASLFLAPVVFFSIWSSWEVKPWAIVVSFVSALMAGIIYMLENGGYIAVMAPVFGAEHKYVQLLVLCVIASMIGSAAFVLAHKRV